MTAGKPLLLPSRRSDVPPFYAMDVLRSASALKAAGRDVLSLCVGQPSIGAPKLVRDEAARLIASDIIGYTEALGLPALRERIAQYYRERYGVSVPAERIVATTGSSGAFLLAFLAAFDDGARIALARPGYPPYFAIQKALDLEAVPVDVDQSTGFQITADHVDALISQPGGLNGVMLASPANPTGSMLPKADFAALIGACAAHGVRLISDEIYHGITFGKREHSALEFTDDAIIINSFSKYFCMTGWRLGWMVVPQNLVRPIEALVQSFYISAPTISQAAAIRAFDCTEELDQIVAGYARNRDILMEALPKMGITRFAPVDGAFYLYADVSPFTNDSMSFCARLLDDTGVALTPGVDFDARNGHSFVRISFAGSEADTADAMRRLQGWLRG